MDFLTQIPRWELELAFVVYAAIVTVVVVLERRRPTTTLALVLSMVFLPVVGLVTYLLFSRRRVKRRIRAREEREIDPLKGTRTMANLEALPEGLGAMQRGLVRLAMKSSAAPLRRAGTVELLTTPEAAFASVTQAFRDARRCIHAEFYIWRDDVAARAVTALLAERAREGVRVRVLIDQLGSWGLVRSHFATLLDAGGEVEIFGRVRIPVRLGRSKVNFRNHRKIITVDGEVGFVGGLNMGDEYFGVRAPDDVGWRDLFVRLDGDAVLGLEATFLDDWLTTTGHVVALDGERPEGTKSLDARAPRALATRQEKEREALRKADPFSARPDAPMRSSGPLTQIIPSGPDIQVAGAIAAQFSAAIGSARTRAYIATPYFIPDEPLMLILRTAALRGVDVRILVPAPRFNDSRLVAYASRSYYDDLLEVGCRIFEYDLGMLHSKYLIADDVAALGSANMDVRSFHINYEITAMFYNQKITEGLAAVFQTDLAHATEVTAKQRLEPRFLTRLLESGARVLSPLL